MSAESRIFIFVNGILNCPGSHDGWTDKAVTWINTRTKDRAEKFEYFCGPISRRLRIGYHANELAHLIAQYSGRRLILVGHSNGCELLCRALRVCGVKVESLHLISGACDADFTKNGLNDLIELGMLKRVTCYVGGRDLPMRLARWTGIVLGWFGLGYGTLGYRGPVNMMRGVSHFTRIVTREEFGHSTWFEPNNFHTLMLEVATRV